MLSNPYTPPTADRSLETARVASAPRGLSIGSFLCGFVAFMAYYGYPGFMTPGWYFGILPALAFLACAMGVLALSGPWQPSRQTRWSTSILFIGLAFPLASFGLNFTLHATTRAGVFWISPRITMSSAALVVGWITSIRIHGSSRGRRLASLGYALGVLQCMTSVVDFLYTDWAP